MSEKTVESKITPEAKILQLEKEVRYFLWVGHGCQGIYGDDGEMQCNNAQLHGFLDFKRQPLEKLREAVTVCKTITFQQLLDAKKTVAHLTKMLEEGCDNNDCIYRERYFASEKIVAVMREALKPFAKMGEILKNFPNLDLLWCTDTCSLYAGDCVKANEALSISPSQLDEDLGKVREALKFVADDAKTGDGWVSIATIERCAESLAILEKWSGK